MHQREIKFRAWDKENRSMHDVEFLGEEVLKIRGAEWENRENFEVMQYTGVNDNKRTKEYPEGQPIYEGDILQINIMDWNRPGNVIASGKAAVEYRGCTFGVEWGFSRDFSGLDSFSRNCTFEVIGNVFDNPDLLEVADAKTQGA